LTGGSAEPSGGLLELRSAVILALAILAAFVVGTLTHFAGRGLAEAILAGLGALGGSIFIFDRAIT
jgi:hypothetical protein